MKPDDSLADRIRRGDPIAPPLGAILTAATAVTRAGMWWRLRATPERVDAYVVSFGNLTAGGTGKTPAVIERAEQEIAQGRRVAVVTRGYHGKLRGGPHVLDRALPSWQAAEQFGDEPALMAHAVPDLVVIKSPDRVAGAQLAIEKHGCEAILLDDAYQNVKLARDENILLIDASNPFGNGRLVPRGILRESLSAMNRATAIWLTRCDQAKDLDALQKTIAEYHPDAPIRRTHHAPHRLRNANTGETLALDSLKGREAAAICAIANPESFFATLEGLGCRLTDKRAYPDHHPFTHDDLPHHDLIITTEKDAIRLRELPGNLHILEIRLQEWMGS